MRQEGEKVWRNIVKLELYDRTGGGKMQYIYAYPCSRYRNVSILGAVVIEVEIKP
jgi:hypothetical protein